MNELWRDAGLHPVLAHVASGLFASVWQAVVLVCLVAVILRVVPRLPAAMRHATWTVTFGLVLGLPLASAYARTLPQALPSSNTGYVVGVGWAMLALAIWAMGSAFRAVQLGLSLAHLRRLAQGCRLLKADDLPLQASGRDHFLAAQLWISRLRKSALLCASADIDRPGVLGLFRPRILLPETLLTSLTESELHQILLHEMEHLRRCDDWSNLLQKTALVLFPINPALWWVERRLCLERELACDEGVLRSTGDRKGYALCLVALAERTLGHRTATLLVGAWSRRSELSLRVRSMLGAEAALPSGRARASRLCLLATACVTTAVLARSPQWISFSAPSAVAAPGRSLHQLSGVPRALGGSYMPVVFHPAVRPQERTVVRSLAVATGKSAHGRRHKHAPMGPPRAASPDFVTSIYPLRLRSPDTPARTYARLLALPSGGSPQAFVAVNASFYAAVPTTDGWLLLEL